jgi:hypothetical protein
VEGILAVLDEGGALGTHKFALLLALFDAVSECTEHDGSPPRAVPTRVLASNVIALHWNHLGPYTTQDGRTVTLAQVHRGTRGPHVYLEAVAALRAGIKSPSGRFGADIKRIPPELLSTQVDRVERALLSNPIPRLQVLQRSTHEFLFHREKGNPVETLEWLVFANGAASALIRFEGVLRPLVEARFLRQIGTINRIALEDERLSAFLFGAMRFMPPRSLTAELHRLQGGRCLYTGLPLGSRTSVDHVVPWSRHPLSTVENLVVTSKASNSAKSNLLLSPRLLERWRDWVLGRRHDLSELAGRFGWQSDLHLTARVAIALYANLPSGTAVWNGPAQRVEPLVNPRGVIPHLATLLH